MVRVIEPAVWEHKPSQFPVSLPASVGESKRLGHIFELPSCVVFLNAGSYRSSTCDPEFCEGNVALIDNAISELAGRRAMLYSSQVLYKNTGSLFTNIHRS